MKRRTVLTGAFAALGLPKFAGAQPYPTQRISYVAPYPAGTTTDILARIVAQILTVASGQSVVVDNKPGAGGTLGSTYVAKARSDGYTLLQASVSTHGINPSLYPNLAYDAVKDFEPVALIGTSPNVVVVNPALPFKSIAELVAAAKAKPGALRYASAGNGSSQHLSGEMFKMLAKVDLQHVPYKGGAAAMTDVIGGQVDLMFEIMPTAMAQARAGKVRALAVTSAQRSPAAPELPTVAESGVPGYEMNTWHGTLAPAHTPKEIITQLHGWIRKGLNTPEMKKHFAELGLYSDNSSPEDFGNLIKAEVARWAPVVKASGAKID
ncbi:MAG: tripartite tricarboxylate transporter substrate binding protein [Betaproteobacteria bacterium]|nr:tripartite tricarboxylate transporter substrate binding protein [Betaproteobacteria bacterium]